ncbi:MAG TPA: hypothetical protein VJK02_13140 [Anaerolineales bacterium]|nr:hypothetical protein [Anaerolineales bacterium]
MPVFPTGRFLQKLKPDQRTLVDRLSDPWALQAFIAEDLSYNFEPDGPTAFGPIEVLKRRTAHCFEGAVFAASVLWYHGHPPTLVLLEAPEDFDHNLIVFSQDGKIGSISQSRHRELLGKPPIFDSLRDLVLSYYPDYSSDWTGNRDELTLRGFSEPIDLRRFGTDWVLAEEVWSIYRGFLVGVRFEKLFPEDEEDLYYEYPEEHIHE